MNDESISHRRLKGFAIIDASRLFGVVAERKQVMVESEARDLLCIVLDLYLSTAAAFESLIQMLETNSPLLITMFAYCLSKGSVWMHATLKHSETAHLVRTDYSDNRRPSTIFQSASDSKDSSELGPKI